MIEVLALTGAIVFLICVMGPPHKHRFTILVAMQSFKGQDWQIWQCTCGKQKDYLYPLESKELVS